MHKPANKKTSHILIAGLGDLGSALATQLLQDGHHVSAIRRQATAPGGVDVYPQDLITAPHLLLPPDPVDLLVIILTPSSRDEAGYRDSFLIAPNRLLDALATQQPLPPIIFVSSTAVFGEVEGDVDENTPPQPSRFNGRILLAAEEELSLRGLLTVVRFAGIHGRSDSFKRRALAIAKDEKALPPPKWMNRIHRDDCVRLLHQLATCWLTQQTAPPLVVGCDNHPLNSHQLYRDYADDAGYTLAISHQPPGGKRVFSRYADRLLNGVN